MQVAITNNSTPKATSRMTLANVKTGRLEEPFRVLLYGVEGIGKSTFAAGAPSPIFLAAEDGTGELEVARFPRPRTWGEALEAIDVLTNESHSFKTLAVDTLDWVEPLIWNDVCLRGKKSSIEDFGYGKGYIAALDEWRLFLDRIERLQAKTSMHVILLAHAHIKTFKNPTGDDYDRYRLKLHEKAGDFVKEWPKAVLFAQYETYAHKGDKEKRARGVTTGARVVHTTYNPAWDAKNRYSLPETMPLDWAAFEAAARARQPESPEKLKSEIAELLAAADDQTRSKVEAWLGTAGDDAQKLLIGLNKLRVIVRNAEPTA